MTKTKHQAIRYMNEKKIKLIAYSLLSVSIIIPAIIIELFNFAMNGSFFSLGTLPKESSAWSDFGSLLAGSFTLLGSIASLATLTFVYQQNKQSLNRADQQLKHTAEQIKDAKEFNKQQSEFIQKQLMQMSYEFNRTQRQRYNELLNDLEADYPSISFKKRNSLYEKIFPNSNFLENKNHETQNENDNEKPLIKISKTLDDIHAQITTRYYRDSRNTILFLIGYIRTELCISTSDDPISGMIFDSSNNYLLNIYDLKNELDILSAVINALLKFNGSDQTTELKGDIVSAALKGSLLATVNLKPYFYKTPYNDPLLDIILKISFMADCLSESPRSELSEFRRISSQHSLFNKSLGKVEFELAIIKLSQLLSNAIFIAKQKSKGEGDLSLLERINNQLEHSRIELGIQ